MSSSHADRPPVRASLVLGVLGVVYGDIGTSPLYAFKASLEHFTDEAGGRANPEEVMGVMSLIFWSLVLIVTVKYVLLVLRADNRGEGGILALMALALRTVSTDRARAVLTLTGVIGACLFFGDGVITPAISVLSAVEGLDVVNPHLREFVLPLSAVVIILLFAIQYRGSEMIGRLFGPIMVVWFLAIGMLGAIEIAQRPSVLLALLPHYAVATILQHGWLAFLALGSVVLAVTGAEALYADMGHFGAPTIRLVWLVLVLPCLALNYFGQGALVLADPAAMANPFFLLCPEWGRLPLVILATAATVIASQALISGGYSVARQCVQLGFLARLVVRHTSSAEAGQIYMPQVNFALLLGVLVLVFAFRSSEALAGAYGIAVTGTFLCTCVLSAVVFRRQYQWPAWLAGAVFGTFFLVDGVFFAANVMKIPEGGWFPLALGLALAALMTSWQRGRTLLLRRWEQDSMPIPSFISGMARSTRVLRAPGTAVFLTANPNFVPNALLHNLKHNAVLHQRVIFLTVQNDDIPEVPAADRTEVTLLSEGIFRVVIHYGFMESPDLPRDLAALGPKGLEMDPQQASYFLGRETLVASTVPKMSRWRMWLFLAMARNSVAATDFFQIPPGRVVELGVRVAI